MGVDNAQRDSALTHYREAEMLLQDQKSLEAIRALKKIIRRYPSSPLKPKAMYTTGWIYENVVMNNDSAAVWYQLLVKEFPSSVYAGNVQPKLAVKADPKQLDQYVKIKEIRSLQPVKQNKGLKAAERRASKETQDEELQRGRRNHQGDDEDDQDDEKDNTDEDDNNDNNL